LGEAKHSVNCSARDFLGAWWRGKAGAVPCAGCSACGYYAGVPVDKKRDRSRLPHLLTERNHDGELVLQSRARWQGLASFGAGARARASRRARDRALISRKAQPALNSSRRRAPRRRPTRVAPARNRHPGSCWEKHKCCNCRTTIRVRTPGGRSGDTRSMEARLQGRLRGAESHSKEKMAKT